MLKKIFLFICFLTISTACFSADSQLTDRVNVYYFYGNMRCYTCMKFEQYSREAVELYCKDEITAGKLQFEAINVEQKGNEHFVDDYQLYTKSLVISLVKNGQEVKSKNLHKIWELVGNKKNFMEYIHQELAGFIKEL